MTEISNEVLEKPKIMQKNEIFLMRNWKKSFKKATGWFTHYLFFHKNIPGLPNTSEQKTENIAESAKKYLQKLEMKELKCIFCQNNFASSASLILHYISSHVEYDFFHKVNFQSFIINFLDFTNS